MKNTKTENERIVEWNQERDLIKTPNSINMMKEISFIIEECIEMVTDMNSEQARDLAEELSEKIMEKSNNISPERVVDAACDIKVFATGIIRKMGYDPDAAMHEVIQEIESRKGKIIDGKFVKDKTPEAQAQWYKADFSRAII